ncbi:MAG: hypothetical protein COA96_18250 [SAR86 cluster bacterium]|uniref:N-acetyltransferase domain-containing protein n=1 Tax=SAR86 cluster bacterium TaxID=2030880 RepID=A0A2A5ABM9_9GAMM|nr:MAG: hypothetical protein COA96_18250 [SAR86 cluster bacterium]
MNIRSFDPERDHKAVRRIWLETGWIDHGNDDDAKYLDIALSHYNTLVADINGEAECMVATVPGRIQHLESELSLSIVAAVTTSFIARKQGMASRLTAQAVANDAANGADVAALGMFEQGYYSRLGFGTGPYEHKIVFDPSQLNIDVKAGIPQRLGTDDYRDVHSALINRWRGHGGVQITSAKFTHAEMGWVEKGFGLGYRNSKNQLTHFIWGESKDEHGPFKIKAIAYQNKEQLLELMALLKNLGDQMYAVQLLEPCHLQMQDLIDTPFRRQYTTQGSDFEEINNAEAFWQIRINNIFTCLEKTCLPDRPDLSFNLTLSDPISDFLPADSKWQGISGEYTIHLGEKCSAKAGHSDNLSLLHASVGGFSRLWLGCASATAISMTGELDASQDLLNKLQQSFSLPLPKTGWDF